MRNQQLSRLVLLLVLVGGLVVGHHPSSGAAADVELELALRYAPILNLVTQDEPCADGEGYLPSDVESVLGQPEVVLRDGDGGLLASAPTASDLFAAGPNAWLDLPGNALDPGCDYETWFRSTSLSRGATTYARVAADPDHPGRIVVQYWLFWVYNDWNDKHEGDWEMLQIAFAADTAEEALGVAPVEVAVAQHEGSERRAWTEVQREGDRVVVYPALGSHATYYTPNRWFGKSAAAGFGCDDTRDSGHRVDASVVMLPDVPTGPDDPFAWLSFEGRWGEQQPSFNNGPTGPSTKDQWEHPITWMEEEGRDSSVSLPELGSGVTDFFCTASEKGSLLFIRLLDEPWKVLTAIVVGVGAVVLVARRTRWSPVEPLPIAHRRRAGQILRSAWRLLRLEWRRFAPVSALVIAGGVLAVIVQYLVLELTSLGSAVDVVDRRSTLAVPLALLAGAVVSIPVGIYAFATTLDRASAIEDGSSGGAIVWRLGRPRGLWPAAAIGLIVVFGGLVVPVALVLLARWCVAPSVALSPADGSSGAFGGSAVLTRGHRWPLSALLAVAVTVALWTGPLVGTLVLLVSGASFPLVNLISALLGAVLLPWLGLVLVLVHGNLTSPSRSAAG